MLNVSFCNPQIYNFFGYIPIKIWGRRPNEVGSINIGCRARRCRRFTYTRTPTSMNS